MHNKGSKALTGHLVIRYIRRLAAILIIFNIITGSLYPLAEGLGLNVPDKIQHFVAYLALAFVLGLSSRPLAMRLFYLALAAGLGGAIEIIQPYVGRHMSLYDFFVNLAGVSVGGVFGIIVRPLLVRLLSLSRPQ